MPVYRLGNLNIQFNIIIPFLKPYPDNQEIDLVCNIELDKDLIDNGVSVKYENDTLILELYSYLHLRMYNRKCSIFAKDMETFISVFFNIPGKLSK